MRVLLEIGSGPDKGRKIRLTTDQSITVGRTEWADFSAPQDPRISAQHFSLHVENDACRIRDLNSRNGTYVNGRLVPEAVVQDGDVVVAGDTHFILRIDTGVGGKQSDGNPTVHGLTPSAFPPREKPVAASPNSTSATPEITLKTVAGGLFHAECSSTLLPPLELLDRVQRHLQLPLYLIVDFTRLGIPCPPEIGQPPILFNWLPEPAAVNSPVVVDIKKFPAALSLIESGWGGDAVVAIASTRPPEELLQHLRSCARVKKDSVLGFCWPSIFSALLMSCDHEMVRRLIEALDLVLIENAENPQLWQVFSHTNLQMLFDKMGLPTGARVAAAN